MLRFSVWVDADSFPVKPRNFLVEYSLSKDVHVVFVSNHEISVKNPGVEKVLCQKEKDSADNYIFEHCNSNDIVVTRDIVFASRLVEKNITVMNDRGFLFTKNNIEDRLKEREFSLNLANIGLGGSGGNYYGEKEFKKFSSTFSEELQKHIIADIYNIK